MKKIYLNKFSKILFVFIAILTLFNVNTYQTFAKEKNTIYLGGMPAGFSLYTRGAYIVGLCDVISENGLVSPSKANDLRVGDVILFINDKEINCALDIENQLTSSEEKTFIIDRNGETIIKNISPAKDMSNKYKLGIFVRDEINGIGTITYIKGDRFGSLGHPIIDDHKGVLQITGGCVFDCKITGNIKGERGKAGELRGVFIRNNLIATIDKNVECGVFGNINKNFSTKKLKKIDLGTAKVGDASIYSTIDGKNTKEYAISIIKIDKSLTSKNLVVKINDKELLSSTGGIIQGMSGSPIVQDGKLVGAITHVFINDPTRGFGVMIDKMINN